MQLLEKKSVDDLPKVLKEAMSSLRYFNIPIMLVGSASIKTITHFGDYDLLSDLSKVNIGARASYDEFIRILHKTNTSLLLTEIKIELKNGAKLRHIPSVEEYAKLYDKIEFIKFDYILYDDPILYDLSSIYSFDSEYLSKNTSIVRLRKELMQLIHEEKWYKVLKRIYSISRLEENLTNLDKLTTFFNDNGRAYRTMSNLEAIKNAYGVNKSHVLLQRIGKNLEALGIAPRDIASQVLKLEKLLGNKAKKFYDDNFTRH